MKPFNLEEYLANPSRKVVTRDGLNAKITRTDAKGKYPIVALIERWDDEDENNYSFTKNGNWSISGEESINDLFFAPEKHEGWVNIYKNAFGVYLPSPIYQTKEEAEEEGKISDGYVTTAKIKWEE